MVPSCSQVATWIAVSSKRVRANALVSPGRGRCALTGRAPRARDHSLGGWPRTAPRTGAFPGRSSGTTGTSGKLGRDQGGTSRRPPGWRFRHAGTSIRIRTGLGAGHDSSDAGQPQRCWGESRRTLTPPNAPYARFPNARAASACSTRARPRRRRRSGCSTASAIQLTSGPFGSLQPLLCRAGSVQSSLTNRYPQVEDLVLGHEQALSGRRRGRKSPRFEREPLALVLPRR
jgi:hypothetical protein